MAIKILPPRESQQDKINRWDDNAARIRAYDPQFADFLQYFVRAPKHVQMRVTAIVLFHSSLARLRKWQSRVITTWATRWL